MTNPLVDLITTNGPVRFDDYMGAALYHPEYGYYSSGKVRTGFGGDFVTSPELSPAFGALWTRAFEAVWSACGQPPEFVVTEIGAGEGGFAASVLRTVQGAFRDALRYRIVEPIPDLRARQEALLDGVTWTDSVEDLEPASAGVLFANEVLDNLPVRLLEGTAEGIREVWVEARDGALVESLRPLDEDLAAIVRSGSALPSGHRFEVPRDAMRFVAVVASSITRGAIVFIDYGAAAHDLASRPFGSLLCYSASGVDDRPLERPGDKDITAHVNWTLVAEVLRTAGCEITGPTRQRTVVDALGSRELAGAYKIEHDEAVAEGRGADAVRALAARSALTTLRDEGGLGGLGVVMGWKAIQVPAFADANA